MSNQSDSPPASSTNSYQGQANAKPKLINQVKTLGEQHIWCTHVLNRGGKGVRSPGDNLFQK